MDTDNWDNGTYIIEGWDIKERLYQQYEDAKMNDSMYENLKFINDKQPDEERLADDEIEAFSKYWEVKHLDRLNEERRKIVEERIKKEQEEQDKEIADIEAVINGERKMTKQDKEKVNKVINELSTDVQKPVENNIKEDNAINDITEKGDDNIARE